MFRKTKLYTCMAVVLAVICVIFLSNCGGGGNSSVVPNTNPTTENPVSYTNPTPTPVLSNVNVSGYLYVNNTVTEDGEIVPSISVLDVPACQSDSSGNESFLTQFSNSIKADYPEDWAKAEIQELYTQLNKTLSESKPLPEYNAQAQVSSAYDDTSIPVSNDGHFDNTVLTGATDSNVKLEVALGEDNYAEVETLPSSGSINSSDATGAAMLKSCPEKIFAFPGEIIIFKVYAEPGINLKSAGLRFTLNNSSIGCITQPVYLCLFGAHKYQVAYGCVYIKPGLNTPVDTTITARLNSGQSMNIFLEVIKKTASISGTVYTGGSTLVKGYVKSLGPKACCKIDASGNYSLPKVFRGHSRSVIATWWTSENEQKIRHREEKVIDFFNSDLTGFNFGVPPTPTPTLTPTATPTMRPLGDLFYSKQTLDVMAQFYAWENEFGTEEAVQKTVDWLNNKGISGPTIPEGVSGGTISYRLGVKPLIEVHYNDGMSFGFYTGNDWGGSISSDDVLTTANDTPRENAFNNISSLEETASNPAIYFKPDDIIILSPFEWQGRDNTEAKTDNIIANLKREGFNPYSRITHKSDLIPLPIGSKSIWDSKNKKFVTTTAYNFTSFNLDNIVTPSDYENLGNYGLIYIYTHGGKESIYGCPVIRDSNDPSKPIKKIQDFLDTYSDPRYINTYDNPTGLWFRFYAPIKNLKSYFPNIDANELSGIEVILLSREIFRKQNDDFTKDFKDSIVYINACQSWWLNVGINSENGIPLSKAFSSATVYIGNNKPADVFWEQSIAYYFFYYMMYGITVPSQIVGCPTSSITPVVEPGQAMHVQQAIDTLSDYKVNPDPQNYGIDSETGEPIGKNDCQLKPIYPNGEVKEIYFPAYPIITVNKNEKNIK